MLLTSQNKNHRNLKTFLEDSLGNATEYPEWVQFHSYHTASKFRKKKKTFRKEMLHLQNIC